jgi:uncharacterized membrane protein
MGKDRLAAFSDGVIAIIITIMVLELHVPHGSDWSMLTAIAPSFLTYVLSFIYVGIYWNNHHHLLHTVTRVDGLILWSGSQSFRRRRPGWGKISLPRYRLPFTARRC